mgnify:CR=1 FL=1
MAAKEKFVKLTPEQRQEKKAALRKEQAEFAAQYIGRKLGAKREGPPGSGSYRIVPAGQGDCDATIVLIDHILRMAFIQFVDEWETGKNELGESIVATFQGRSGKSLDHIDKLLSGSKVANAESSPQKEV